MSGPQVHYNNVAPEAVGSSSENALAYGVAPRPQHLSSSRKIIIAVLITMIVVGVAVGVGVGVGNSRSAAGIATITAAARYASYQYDVCNQRIFDVL